MSRRPTIDRTRISRVAAVLLAAATIGASSTVNAQSSEAPAERAAREIQDARDRANAAAQAMFDKESEVDQLELDIAETEKQLAAVEARANEMRDGLEAQAVQPLSRFVSEQWLVLARAIPGHGTADNR